MTFLEKVAVEAAKMQRRKKKKEKVVHKTSKANKAKKATAPAKAKKGLKPNPAAKPIVFDKAATGQAAFKPTTFPKFKQHALPVLQTALAQAKVTKFEDGGESWGKVYYDAAPEIMFWIFYDLGLAQIDDKSMVVRTFKKQTRPA